MSSFKEVQHAVLKEHEGLIKLNQISPRIFEAAACKVLMILYEGNYSGILKPWEHYLPLKKDHSNTEEIINYIKNKDFVNDIVEKVYTEIVQNPLFSYEKHTEFYENILLENINNTSSNEGKTYSRSKIERSIFFHRKKTFFWIVASNIRYYFGLIFFDFVLHNVSSERKKNIKYFIKHFILFER